MARHLEQAEEARKEAVRVLQLYFKKAFTAAGLKWGEKNDVHIEAVVDLIRNSAILESLAPGRGD